MSCAGHLKAGESYEEGASRELAEELGLEGQTLTKLFDRTVNERFENGRTNREQQAIYTLTTAFSGCRPAFPELSGVYLLPIAGTRKVLSEEQADVQAHGLEADATGAFVAQTRRFTADDFIRPSFPYLRQVLTLLEEHGAA
jgi:ADP-ribose pyrophosphatase YjhB (NUDIX family)